MNERKSHFNNNVESFFCALLCNKTLKKVDYTW